MCVKCTNGTKYKYNWNMSTQCRDIVRLSTYTWPTNHNPSSNHNLYDLRVISALGNVHTNFEFSMFFFVFELKASTWQTSKQTDGRTDGQDQYCGLLEQPYKKLADLILIVISSLPVRMLSPFLSRPCREDKTDSAPAHPLQQPATAVYE